MNWASYPVNQLEQDCHEVQDQGYEFHFNWLLILIAFITWEIPKGATFPKVEPFEPLATRFHPLVFERHGEAMAVQCGVPHILLAVE
jgi:hypothetical protein